MLGNVGALPADLHYEETGAGEPLVFLPGFSVGFIDYPAIRAALARHWRVISVDLPGSGRSGPQPRTYTRHYWEDDAHVVAAFMKSRVSGPAHIVGHSDGGEVGLLIGALHPEIARSVVAWGATGAIDETHRGAVAYFHNIIDDTSEESATYRDHLISAYGEQNAQLMTQSFAEVIRAAIEDGGDISRSRAHKIRCPVLLVAGEHDVFASRALIEAYASRVPQAKTVEIAGAGHDVHDTHAQLFEQTVVDWLRSH